MACGCPVVWPTCCGCEPLALCGMMERPRTPSISIPPKAPKTKRPGAHMLRESTRREFMKQTAALSAAVWVSGQAAAASRSANEKLNIAAIGAAGKGRADIHGCSSENIVALCDVDGERAAEMFKK